MKRWIDQKRLKGTDDRAGHILDAEQLDLGYVIGFSHHSASDDISMSIHVLGEGVDHHIRSQFQGTLEIRGGKGVVTNHLDFWIVSVYQVADRLDVGDFQVGVGRGFQVHHSGVRAQGGLDRSDGRSVSDLPFPLCHGGLENS